MLDDVIEIKKPDLDSHFKLLPCKCKSDNVAYVHYNGRGGAKWRVKCFDCGFTVTRVIQSGMMCRWRGIGR